MAIYIYIDVWGVYIGGSIQTYRYAYVYIYIYICSVWFSRKGIVRSRSFAPSSSIVVAACFPASLNAVQVQGFRV